MERKRILHLVNLMFEISQKFNELDHIPRDFGVEERLTRAEIHMLEAVRRGGEPSVTELAGMKGITKGAVSQLLNRLADKGLIKKGIDERNASRLRIGLTDSGRVACQGHEKMHDEILRYIAEHVGEIDDRTAALLESLFFRIDHMLDHILAEEG